MFACNIWRELFPFCFILRQQVAWVHHAHPKPSIQDLGMTMMMCLLWLIFWSLRATFGFSSLSLSFFFFILHQIAFEIHTLSTWLNADWSKGNTDNVFALFNILFEVCMQHLTTSSGEKSMCLNEHGGLLFPIVIMLFYFLPYCNLLWKSHNLVWDTCENL
jgi:hypothetical protein